MNGRIDILHDQSRRDDTLLTVGGASEAQRNLRNELPHILSWQSRRDGTLLTADFNLRNKTTVETGHAPSLHRQSKCLNGDFNKILRILRMQGNSQSRRDFQGDIAVGFSQRKKNQSNHINQTNHSKITVQTIKPRKNIIK